MRNLETQEHVVTDSHSPVHGVLLQDGKTIVLDHPLNLPDGDVYVLVQPSNSSDSPVPANGEQSAFGAWANDDPAGLDEYIEWSRQQRKLSRGGA